MKKMKRILLLAPLMLAGCVIYRTPDDWIPARDPLTPERISAMKSAGDSDAAIRRELQFHGVEHALSADELVVLKEAGVSDEVLKAAAEADVKTPQEAKPVYHRGSHRHSRCDSCHHSAAPFHFATALSLNYLFGRHWGCRRW
jgi:hypothetical protein